MIELNASRKLFQCCLAVLLWTATVGAQQWEDPLLQYPKFDSCQQKPQSELRACFESEMNVLLGKAFSNASFEIESEASISVLFEVGKQGQFILRYVDSASEAYREMMRDFFAGLSNIKPASYNGRDIYMQFSLSFRPKAMAQIKWSERVSSDSSMMETMSQESNTKTLSVKAFKQNQSQEFGSVTQDHYRGEAYRSGVLIPLSHRRYDEFDAAMNQLGSNSHTAQKPYRYNEVKPYYNLAKADSSLMKPRKTWFGRKWWNEHMVAFSAEDYWFTLDPGLDIETGRDGDLKTYNNTRLVHLQGGLGDRINISAVVYESQGRFANYFNAYAESIKPDGGNPAIIPGFGIAKEFRTDSYDYPIATGYVSYTANKFFNLQFGHGKQFIGDGYRSLMLSDNASPYPYLQLNTTVWKLKYTNTWMSLRDVRPEVTADGSFRTKYMANHYLS